MRTVCLPVGTVHVGTCAALAPDAVLDPEADTVVTDMCGGTSEDPGDCRTRLCDEMVRACCALLLSRPVTSNAAQIRGFDVPDLSWSPIATRRRLLSDRVAAHPALAAGAGTSELVRWAQGRMLAAVDRELSTLGSERVARAHRQVRGCCS